MKKTICIFLALILLLSIPVVYVSADDNAAGKQYKERFCQFASWGCDDYRDVDVDSYRELYYHIDNQGKTDWAFVTGKAYYSNPTLAYFVIGDRVFTGYNWDIPFILDYGVYDVKDDTFYDLVYVWNSGKYEGITDVVSELGLGRKIGDINCDGKLSIKDATEIQRCLAEFRNYPDDDEVEAAGFLMHETAAVRVNYLSDVNHNEVRDIGDVTAIQRILAEY